MSARTDRVAETIKEELGIMLERGEIKDPRIGFVTFTDVEVSKDIRHAWVYFSCLGGLKRREKTMEGLLSARGHIRTELGKRLHLKNVPEIEFRFDETIEAGAKIAKLINKIHAEEKSDDKEDRRSS